MNIGSIITRFLFVIAIPALAFTASITFAVNNSDFYVYRFEKYGVEASLAEKGIFLPENGLQKTAEGFIKYFNSGDEYIYLTAYQDGALVELFNDEEKIHFRDVKGLFILNYWVFGVSLAYFIIYALAAGIRQRGKFRQYLAWNTVIGSGLTLGLMLLMGLGIILDFDWLFYQFHLISFSNEFWSAEGNMLLLFPQGFWVDAVRYCAIFTAAVAAVIGLAGGLYLWLHKHRSSA